jgi:hypothetical protein
VARAWRIKAIFNGIAIAAATVGAWHLMWGGAGVISDHLWLKN